MIQEKACATEYTEERQEQELTARTPGRTKQKLNRQGRQARQEEQ
jgi:hypothetical protein